MFELTVIFNPEKYNNHLIEMRDKLNKDNLSKEDRPFIIFNLSYILWSIIGLFTNYYPLFLFIFILGAISSRFKFEKSGQIVHRFIDALLTSVVLFLIFYLHFIGT